MSPMISSKKSIENELSTLNQKQISEKDKLIKLREFIEKNFEFAGDQFSKKVREVYYDKKNKRGVYGTTTKEEREELEEEGIDLVSIPWVSKDN